MKAATSNLTQGMFCCLIFMLAATVVCAQRSAGPDVLPVAPVAGPAIAFDQIDRLLLHGEAPPPVDSFASDAAVIVSLPPLTAKASSAKGAIARTAGTMLVSSALSFIPIAGPLVGGASSRALNAVQQAAEQRENEKHNAALAHFISAGTLSHFAFYYGWIRSERRWELTIVKPDEGLTSVANLLNKTVRTIDEHTSPETVVIDTTEGLPPPALLGEAATERVPDVTVSGLHARGYRTTATIDLKYAMGWCALGRHKITQVEYVTDLPDPQSVEVVTVPRSLTDGCEPSSTASYREPGRLALYRATSIDPDTPKGITLVFERGNVRKLDESSVSLFSIPIDFMKE
jgi:hypothetical protein